MTTLITQNSTMKGSLKLKLIDDSNLTIKYLLVHIWSEFTRLHKGVEVSVALHIDKLERIQYKLAFKSVQRMSPIDHNYDHIYVRFSIPYLRHILYTHDAIIAFNLVHNLRNSSETIVGFRSRSLPYNLRIYPAFISQRCLIQLCISLR